MVRELPDVDHCQTYRIMGQARKGFFTHTRYPDKNIFPGLNVQVAIQRDHGNVITDGIVGDHPIGLEAHIHIEANLLSCPIAAFSDISGQAGKVVLHFVSVHAGQSGANAQNGGPAMDGIPAVCCGRQATAADERDVCLGAKRFQRLQRGGEHAFARHAAHAIAEHRVAMALCVAGPRRIDGA